MIDGARLQDISRDVSFDYSFPRPSVTCDVVVFTIRYDDLAVLLIRRKKDPFRGSWALPGGFVNENEALDRAAARELYEETGVSGVKLDQISAFGDPGRDPRGHTVTVAWMTYLVAEVGIVAGDDAERAEWYPLRSLGIEQIPQLAAKPASASGRGSGRATGNKGRVRLAFDHERIIVAAYRRLCQNLDPLLRDVAFDLMPPRFTLAEFRQTFEIVFGRPLTAPSVRRNLVDRGLVVPATHKPAARPSRQLYRWHRR